jgi:NTE family protein
MTQDTSIEALRQALPALLGNLDDSTFEAIRPHLRWDWVERAGGEVLFREGDPSDCLYLVLSGRLQACVGGSDGQPQLVGEIGRGESVGEMGAFTGKPRQATVTALRDTVLARIELPVFQEILKASPALALNLNRIIIERLERRNTSPRASHNVTNIAVVSISRTVRASAMLERLVGQLQRRQHNALHLTTEMINSAAGRPDAAQATDADPAAHHWLVQFLDNLEERHALVFYEADPALTPWTRRCLRVADEVLLLADATQPPQLGDIEQQCLGSAPGSTRVRQTLVLLQPASLESPTGTRRFLDARPGVSRHFHVRLDSENDLGRLGRFFSNEAIGLVLAGGGARGLSHVGVFQALEEAGIVVDSVGGTSMGSLIAAAIAFDRGGTFANDLCRRLFLSKPTTDYNWLPIASLLTGRKLERLLNDSPAANIDIEDLWLPFFCVSSNYTQACEHVHRGGSLKHALTASIAIPGVFPPVVHGNDLLVDGGLFNNMPVDVMAGAGVRTILAVDVGKQAKPRNPFTFDRVPGTWALLLDRLRPKASRRYPIPSMLALLVATPTLNSAHKTRAVSQDVDLLFRPDVSGFGMLDWKSYDTLVEIGRQHGREMLAAHWPVHPTPRGPALQPAEPPAPQPMADPQSAV